MPRALLLEDDPEIGPLLASALTREGYVTDLAPSIGDARALLDCAPFDVLVLDRALPDGDSLGMLRALRRAGLATPALMLTARDAVPDRLQGFDAGADDYLVKPFALAELLARLRALLRRPGALEPDEISVGRLVLHLPSRTVEADGQPVPLRRQEVAFLELLMRGAGRVVARERLDQALFALSDAPTPNALEQIASRLRRTLASHAPDFAVEAIRGVGYVLRDRRR